MEGIKHREHGTPHPDLGRIRRGTSQVWTPGEFLGPPKIGVKTEWKSRAGLPSHTGNDTGKLFISDTLQLACGKFNQYMVGHDSGGPED